MKPDFRIYKRETTKYWTDEIQSKAGRIFDVCLFDANKQINICSFTRNYELWPIGPTWTKSFEDDRIFEEILKGFDDQIMYIDVRYVKLDQCEAIGLSDEHWERLLKENEGGDVERDGDAAWQEALSFLAEYCSSNGWCY